MINSGMLRLVPLYLACVALFILVNPHPGQATSAIEVRTHEFQVIQRSRSGRVYLVSSETLSDSLPPVGKVFLAKRSERPYMGLRVLKAYDGERRFAVKKIKEYRPGTFLYRDTRIPVLEKVGDRSEENAPPLTPQERAQDTKDLQEIENLSPSTHPGAAGTDTDPVETNPVPQTAPAPGPGPDVQKFDPDIDAGVTPREEPMGSADDDLTDLENIMVRESVVLDPESRWLSFNLSFMRSGREDGIHPYYLSGGVSYGFDLSKQPFLQGNKAQDSFTLEGLLHYYQVTEEATYSVMPIGVTLRYNVFTSENLGFFGYGGISKNFVLSVTDPYRDEQFDAVDIFVPAFGVGLLFKVGPNWMARVDVGFDQVGVGAVLRF